MADREAIDPRSSPGKAPARLVHDHARSRRAGPLFLRIATQLPSARTLSAQLGAARGTIDAAYDLLAGEGAGGGGDRGGGAYRRNSVGAADVESGAAARGDPAGADAVSARIAAVGRVSPQVLVWADGAGRAGDERGGGRGVYRGERRRGGGAVAEAIIRSLARECVNGSRH